MIKCDDYSNPNADDAQELGRKLAAISPGLESVLQEHLQDNEGEVLSTLFLSDVVRWLSRGGSEADDERTRVFTLLGNEYETGNEYIQNVIVTGFLENLPFPSTPGREVVNLLPPSLRDALADLEGAGADGS